MRKFITAAALLLLPAAPHAEIGLNQEISFTVPQLTGPIRAWSFEDIDHDGAPEILTTDSTSLLIYSYQLDSVFLDAPIPADWSGFHVLLADINRDSVADAVLGGYFDSSYTYLYRIRAYDGASGFDSMVQKSYVATFTFTGLGPIGITALQAIDIDSDGYNEMLLSFDSIASTGSTDYTVGASYLYHSFPDSVQWRRGRLTTDLIPWIPRNDTTLFLDHEHYRYYSHVATDYTYSLLTPQVCRADGIAIDSFDTPSMGNCLSWTYLYSRNHDFELACRGDIDSNSPGEEILLFFNWGYQCDFTGASGARLEARKLVSADSTEILWQKDVTVGQYDSFIYYPGFPGIFFGIDEINHCVTEFSGADGSVRQTSAVLPAGTLSWSYPFADSLPRLTLIDSNTVTFYTLDVATGINDGGGQSLPTAFTLGEPYPNPFNPTTTIALSLPHRGDLTVEVYNLLGQKVTVLHDGFASAGDMTLTWDASKQSSGVYFIRARFDGAIRTVKAMLLK